MESIPFLLFVGRNGQEPEGRVFAKDLDKVVVCANVVHIGPSILVFLLLLVLYGSRVGEHPFHVKSEQQADGSFKGDYRNQAYTADDGLGRELAAAFDDGTVLLNLEEGFPDRWEGQGKDDVEEHQHEELAVIDADTVGDPGAVVVHL